MLHGDKRASTHFWLFSPWTPFLFCYLLSSFMFLLIFSLTQGLANSGQLARFPFLQIKFYLHTHTHTHNSHTHSLTNFWNLPIQLKYLTQVPCDLLPQISLKNATYLLGKKKKKGSIGYPSLF